MAKKKRRHYIKLNNKVREIFNNSSFDDGIVTLSDDELLELVLLLDLGAKCLGREELIKVLRRAWSDGGYIYRKIIVDHLSGKKEINIKKKRQQSMDKVDLILQLLSNTGHSKDEELDILSSFIDVKPEKITLAKIENRLNYGRRVKRLEKLQDDTGVTIDNESKIHFTYGFLFELGGTSFSKNMLCISESIELDSIWTQNDEDIVDHIKNQKSILIISRQKAIDLLIGSFDTAPAPLLSTTEAINALRAMAPHDNPTCPPLSTEIVEKLFSDLDKNIYLFESQDHIIFELKKSHILFGEAITYTVSVSYFKDDIYCDIWQKVLPDVTSKLEQKSKLLVKELGIKLESLTSQMRELSVGLDLSEDTYREFILNFASARIESSATLSLRDKSIRRVLYHFQEYISPLLERQKREELLAKSIRDFKSLFSLARSLRRKIVFHVGPTNSGKTYAALQELSNATTGYYLAPLRLLALEGYENLKARKIPVSLVTGEEEIIDEDSTHISSTIEMMNGSVDVDICVIDEIQMIDDRDRGWAWANALIGAPAKKVILTGSYDALEAVEQLCHYLGEELEVIHFERKNHLYIDSTPTPLHKIEPQTALIAFSRKDVLSIKHQLSDKYSVSVVYGNLSPEVRREEARRFRDGTSSILVATDAIAMGLNLPIKHILFTKDSKFDGIRRRNLKPTEVQQISGRAGRYGLKESGHVGALNESMLKNISKSFSAELAAIALPVSVMANFDHAMLISEILQSSNMTTILGFFSDNMEFDGPFVAANMDSMLEIATIVDNYDLDVKTKYYLCCAPASISSPYIESVFNRYIKQIQDNQQVQYIPSRDLPPYAQTNEMLLNAEDRVREISLYLWLSFKFPDSFLDTKQAIEARYKLNAFIEKSLRSANFTKKCIRCDRSLDFSYRYSICDECHGKAKRGYRRSTKRHRRNKY